MDVLRNAHEILPGNRSARLDPTTRRFLRDGKVPRAEWSSTRLSTPRAAGDAPSRRFPVMVEWAVPAGLLCGIFCLLVMYRGVIPLTAAMRTLYLPSVVRRPLPGLWPVPFFVHMFCVGLPIALSVRRFGPWPRNAARTLQEIR